jgi:hypothetical protein
MKCPSCTVSFHASWEEHSLVWGSAYTGHRLRYTRCPSCSAFAVYMKRGNGEYRLIDPAGANRGPVPSDVPRHIASDYVEACNVLPISAKASAALSRRCLQNILHGYGYVSRDLAKEIDLLLNEPDPRKAIPSTLRVAVDGIRNFGNFSAHPIDDKNNSPGHRC